MVRSVLRGYFNRRNVKKFISAFAIVAIFALQMPVITTFAAGENWIDDAAAYQPPMAGDIFLVSTANQLAWVSYMVQNGSTFNGKTVELQNDIDLAGKEWSPIGGWNGTQKDTNKRFRGTFDGKKYIIKNMAINLPNRDYIGFFGCVDSYLVQNIGMVNIDVMGNSYVGGLIGYSTNYNSTVSNCYVTGNITGTYQYIGGLIGYNYSTISNCYSKGSVTGGEDVGGLIGRTNNGTYIPTISNCYAKGDVSGGASIGGLIGYADSGMISNCYTTGNVTGNSYIGGLIGFISSPTTSNSYATGNVTGNSYVGGLIGYSRYEIRIIAYWNTNIQQEAVGIGTLSIGSKLTGLTTAEMQSPAFADMLNDHININWAAWKYDVNNENDGYPILDYAKGIPDPDKFWIANAHEPTIVGDTYEIRTAGQLAWIAKETNGGNKFSGKTVKLINNIDLQGKEWTPIGSDYTYSGIFDGDNKKIQNLTIGKADYPGSFNTTYSYYGLLGYVNGGKIQNIGIENVNIHSRSDNVGGLVGRGPGTITNCYVAGNVTGNSYVGGLVGYGYYGTITNCYAIGNVTGNNNVGGLAGYGDRTTLTNCYATGNVTGNIIVGGLIGSGNSSAISSSFWNKSAMHKVDGFNMPDANKRGVGNLATDPVGLVGKALIELNQQSTYAGWDFTNTWAIDLDKNGGLPYLHGFDMADVAVSGITLIPIATALNVGEEKQLQATISPANASNTLVSYNSSAPNIASVNESGKVTAISEGRTIITVTTQDGNKNAACEVIVNPKAVVFDYRINLIEILNSQYINIAIPQSGGFYASANITKNTAISGAKSVLMAVYEKSGKLMLIKPATIRLNQGQSTSIDIWIDNIDNAKIGTIKVFAWDDTGNMLPLSNVGLYENK